MDEYNTSLPAAVHKGDVINLVTLLSSISDPELYLNRVYDEPNGQKCTLLMIACLAEYDDIVQMLLNCFKPDLEVLNIIQMNNDDLEPEIYENVTVLWTAAAVDNFSIVKQLVKHGANVNHTTTTMSTPVRCACSAGNLEMVCYLVENGADIHINKKNNQTNLALSVYRKHLTMADYLISSLGCDINECDGDGCSPLYFAVKCGSLDMVEYLLKHGANNFPATHNHMSPLLFAAESRREDLMAVIIPYCSTLESIEAEELLGSAFACAEYGPCDLQKSFEHLHRALEFRSTHNLPKSVRESTSKALNNRHESQTIEELKQLQLNLENMYSEAFIVRERILGPANDYYHFSLIFRGIILADNGQFHDTLIFWLYELELCQQYSMPTEPEHLRRFLTVFSEMMVKSSSIPIEAILKIQSTIVQIMKQNTETIDYNLHTLLFLTTIASQPSVDALFSATDRKAFYGLLHSINHNRYVTHDNHSSLIHLSLSNRISTSDVFDDNIYQYPCLYTVRTLLRCNANVNAMDAVGNTPLHVLASNSDICDENILDLLCAVGSHLDYVNAKGETPFDIASNSNTKQLLKAKMKLSLKCLCARLIKKNKISFDGMISNSLRNFVERH